MKKVFHLFGAAIHESLTRTMGKYLQVTGGRLANIHKSEWEKEIAGRMACTNNAAESPFATVRAFLNIYPRYPFSYTIRLPLKLNLYLYMTLSLSLALFLTTTYASLKLREVATLSQAMMNGTHRPAHKKGKQMIQAGMALTAPDEVKTAVSKLCSIRRRSPGTLLYLITHICTHASCPECNPTAPNPPPCPTGRSVNIVLSREQHVRCCGGCRPKKKEESRRDAKKSTGTCKKNG